MRGKRSLQEHLVTIDVEIKENAGAMRKKLLLVMEAIQMNGAVKGWLGYLSAIKRSEWDIDLFLFDPEIHDGLQLPEGVALLPENIHCVIERVGFGTAIMYALKRGRIDLVIKRTIYSLLQRWVTFFKKWNLVKPAAHQPKHYDVAIGSSQGVSWEYVATKVCSDVKLLWVDTDVRKGYWPLYWNHFKKYIDDVSGVVCVSKAMRDQMREDNPQWKEKIFALNYVIDVDAIVQKSLEECPPAKKRQYRFVTVGRYSQEKGQHLIPAIAENLRNNNIDFEWYVVAPGSSAHKDKIDAELEERNVKDYVLVTEGMNNPFPLVKSADISVQPSSFEGFGLTVSEAMILGAYVVASDIPSFREQVVADDLGVLVTPIDSNSFAEAIRQTLERVKSGQVRKGFQTPYSKENTYRQFKEILQSVWCVH